MKKKRRLLKIILILAALSLIYGLSSENVGNKSETASPVHTFAPVVISTEKSSSEGVDAELVKEPVSDPAVPDEPASEPAPVKRGLRPEFKAAMDSYEAFYDKYIELLQKYQNSPNDLGLLTQYMELFNQLDDMDTKFDDWENNDLNDEELQYYLEVNLRVEQKLLGVM